jgi:hypothetical protein
MMQGQRPAPGRPSQESFGYGPYARGSVELAKEASRRESQGRLPVPPDNVLFDGYRKDILNEFQGEQPRWNPVCTNARSH